MEDYFRKEGKQAQLCGISVSSENQAGCSLHKVRVGEYRGERGDELIPGREQTEKCRFLGTGKI